MAKKGKKNKGREAGSPHVNKYQEFSKVDKLITERQARSKV